MMRLLVLAFALAAPLLASSSAHACKCMLPPLEAAREDASALFEARVLSIELVDPGADATNGEKKVTLAVVRTWKGVDSNEQVVAFTNGSTAACGYPFAKDTSYLVFAREHEGRLTVSNCSRTKPLADAGEDLAALGAGATPVTVVPKTSAAPAAPADGAGTPSAAPAPEKKGCGGGSHALLPWLVLPMLRRRRHG